MSTDAEMAGDAGNPECLTMLSFLSIRIKMFSRIWFILVVTTLLVGGAAAAAKRKKVKQLVIKEATRVEGKIQKPEVWYLLPRTNLKFESDQLKQKLVPKIEKSAEQDIF